MATEMTKQEQLDKYLEAREALKEKFRLRYRREAAAAAAAEQPKKSNFGGYSSSFFGPSVPSAAPRLLRNFFGGAPSANAAGDNNKKREQQQAPLHKKREFIKSPAPPSAGSRTKKSVLDSSRNPNQVVYPKSREIPNPEKNRAGAVVRKPNPNPEKRVPVVDSNRKFKAVNPNPHETLKSGGSNQKLMTRSRDDRDYVLWKRRRIEEEEEEREAEKAFSEIRKMFNTSRFIGRDDRDFGAMESSFEQIGKEERRSAKLAREEDAEELRLIALEEQREKERKRRLAATAAPGKKRKFQDSDSDSE